MFACILIKTVKEECLSVMIRGTLLVKKGNRAEFPACGGTFAPSCPLRSITADLLGSSDAIYF